MDRESFLNLDLKADCIGKKYKIEGEDLKLVLLTSFGWSQGGSRASYLINECGLEIYFYKTLDERCNGYPVTLHVIGYKGVGPSGLYGEVNGIIGATKISRKAIHGGTVGFPPIPEIVRHNGYTYIVYTHISYFIMAIFRDQSSVT
ncbi:MAG TPA: hypothetical protein VK492_09425 [Chitinophagaceae bacterium]|nr:hypothetical protein [Chitinophagaceae bacterium]